MSTSAGEAEETTPLVKEADKDAENGDMNADEADEIGSGFLPALVICILFSFSVQTVTNTQILVSSQLEFVSQGPWFSLEVSTVLKLLNDFLVSKFKISILFYLLFLLIWFI